MDNYLEYYYKKYPKSELIDFLKLTYQATFGTGHNMDTPSVSLLKLKEEIANLKPVDFYEDLYDYISFDYARINLRVYKMYNLNVNLLNESYLNTSYMFVDNNKTFTNEVDILNSFLTSKSFDTEKLYDYFEQIEDSEFTNLPHSDVYIDNYQPSYVVIHQKYLSEELKYYQIRHYLESFKKDKLRFFAVEGKSASGKSTIANLLKKEQDITLVHMDDFFDHHNEEIGINSERIVKEIITSAVFGNPLKYNKYDCTSKTYTDELIPKVTSTILFEGVYSANPILRDFLSGIIYIHINDDIQQDRLMRRNRFLYNRFVNEWIPREKRYFEKYNIIANADIIV